MSNMTGVTKDMYPDGTTASLEGFHGLDGELLVGCEFTQAEVDEWNGVKPKPVVKAAPKAKVAKKKSTKAKKKNVWKTMKSAFE
jgi:hypothetical protein